MARTRSQRAPACYAVGLFCLAVATACEGGGGDRAEPAPAASTESEPPPAAEAPQEAAEPTTDELIAALPAGDTEALKRGREILANVCVKCHIEGLGDAPVVTDADAWAPRVAKPRETLYQHAIEGFWGDVGEMPARGDDEHLSDEDVKKAVDYIVSLQPIK